MGKLWLTNEEILEKAENLLESKVTEQQDTASAYIQSGLEKEFEGLKDEIWTRMWGNARSFEDVMRNLSLEINVFYEKVAKASEAMRIQIDNAAKSSDVCSADAYFSDDIKSLVFSVAEKTVKLLAYKSPEIDSGIYLQGLKAKWSEKSRGSGREGSRSALEDFLSKIYNLSPVLSEINKSDAAVNAFEVLCYASRSCELLNEEELSKTNFYRGESQLSPPCATLQTELSAKRINYNFQEISNLAKAYATLFSSSIAPVRLEKQRIETPFIEKFDIKSSVDVKDILKRYENLAPEASEFVENLIDLYDGNDIPAAYGQMVGGMFRIPNKPAIEQLVERKIIQYHPREEIISMHPEFKAKLNLN